MSGLPQDVLIVEDDPLIAMDFEAMIAGFGVPLVRIAGTAAAALDLIRERVPDFALLDIGLAHEKSFAVAEELQRLNVPFAFATGYSDPSFERFAAQPLLMKPCTREAMQAMLTDWRGAAAKPGPDAAPDDGAMPSSDPA